MEKRNDYFENLETNRLILREIEDNDFEMLYKNIFNNFEYYKFHSQTPFNSFEEYKESVNDYKKLYEEGNHFKWGVVLKESNEMIGLVQLHTEDILNNHCKIAWLIGYNYNGHGYAKEAVQEMIKFAFNKVKYHRIDAEIVETNDKSIKLAENLGMYFETIKKENYKLGNEYYDQKVYVIINDKS